MTVERRLELDRRLRAIAVAADVLLLPTIDLTVLRLATSLAAVAVLLYGFIWEAR